MKRSILGKITQGILITVGFMLIGIVIYSLVIRRDTENIFFNWLQSVAPIIAASATLALAWAAFRSINLQREERNIERQRQALERIRIWAEETFESISRGQGHGFEGINPMQFVMQEGLRVAKGQLLSRLVKSMGVRTEAKQLGGDIYKEVELATQSLSTHIDRLGTKKDITQFREFIDDKDFGDESEPFSSLEEVTTAERKLMAQLRKVIDIVTKALVPN